MRLAREPGDGGPCARAGLWVDGSVDGNRATGLHVADVDVDLTRTGVYLEHFTYRSLFERIRVGRGVRVGLSADSGESGLEGSRRSCSGDHHA